MQIVSNVQAAMIRQKMWLPGGWANFPCRSIYKTLKAFLSDDPLKAFNIVWQEYSFSDLA